MKLSSKQFRNLSNKSVSLIGMSGVGKTTLARALPKSSWFHYSTDYRIGTRYLNEPILDIIKEKAMSIEFLRDLLRSDSIFIGSAMTFDNLALLSKFIGKLGNTSQGGLSLEEFRKRQRLHHKAEVQASLDVCEFIRKAHTIYGYDHFINDSSGSICELGDERVFQHLAQHTVIIYLEASKTLEHKVVERQEKYPKPLYYEPQFLNRKLAEYLQVMDLTSPDQIDPNDFTCWIFPSLMKYRRPKYEYIASKYGYSIPADGVESVRDEQDFVDFVCIALDS